MKKDWSAIIQRAKELVNSYDTGVTLRQLFYRLVSEERLPNTRSAYNTLSQQTAEARRRNEFPELEDRTRQIHQQPGFDGVHDAKKWLSRIYRRDRTEGQTWAIYIGVEKDGLVNQLQSWFDEYGLPIIAVKGYPSQSLIEDIKKNTKLQDRATVLLYGGDFDPSGEDISRDLQERTQCFDKVEQVALNREQVQKYNLPPQMGKTTDTRASRFTQKHGELVQVEIDAIPPDILRALYMEAVNKYIDLSMFQQVCDQEQQERDALIQEIV